MRTHSSFRYRNSERMSLSPEPNSNSGGVQPFAGSASSPVLPAKVGKYLVRRELGRGGMGVVYEAADPFLERFVAIKLLQPRQPDPQGLDRLLREARWAARLHHPNAVSVYDAGEFEGGLFIAMELVRGASACDRLQQHGRFHWRAATRIVAEVCQALSAAHAAKVIHRDIKPANILLVDAALAEPGTNSASADGASRGSAHRHYRPWAKLSDFGLSRSLHSPAPVSIEGQVVGTPHYMSPEQIRGEQLDERTDIYSLGATFFTLLTGRFPFERDEVIQILFAHCSAPIPNPLEFDRSLPPACRTIVARCLAKEPRDRYRSAFELLRDLEDLLAWDPTPICVAPHPYPPSGSETISSLKTLSEAVTLPAIDSAKLGRFTAASLARRSIMVVGLMGVIAIAAVGFHATFLANQAARKPESFESVVSPTQSEPTARPALPLEGVKVERRWSPDQNGLLHTTGEMEFMRLAPDGRTLVWGVSEDEDNWGRLTLFDIERQEIVGMHTNEQKYASFSAVAFPNERFVLLAYSSRVIAYDRETREETRLITVDDGSARSIDVSADGRTLAVGVVGWSGGGRVEVYDLVFETDGPRVENRRRANHEHEQPVRCVAISPDGRTVASADANGAVLLGSLASGKTLQQWSIPEPLEERSELGYCVQFSPDGRWVTAGGHPSVVLWNVASGERRLLPQKHQRGVMSLAFSSDSRFVASGTTDGVRIWNVDGGWQAGDMLEGHDGNVITGIAWAREDSLLITSGFDRNIRFWNLGRLKRSVNDQ